MYYYNPYIPYRNEPNEMNAAPQAENPYGNEAYLPDYMSMGMPMSNMPMSNMPMSNMPMSNLPMSNLPMSMPMVSPMAMPMPYVNSCFMEPMKEKKCVKVPEVIGRNYCQILLEQEIPFAPNYPALEIKDIDKDVKDLILSVCKDKVLVNGKLHKNINYKTYDSSGCFKCGCEEYDVIFGDVRHVHVCIPFSGFIEVPGARPGDNIEIEYAGVEDLCELDILKDPCYVKGLAQPVFKKLKEKVIVKIEVKVLRPVQITVEPRKPNICP